MVIVESVCVEDKTFHTRRWSLNMQCFTATFMYKLDFRMIQVVSRYAVPTLRCRIFFDNHKIIVCLYLWVMKLNLIIHTVKEI